MSIKYKAAILKALGIIMAAFLLNYIYSSNPNNGPILPCIFYHLTGYYCPGCGMTRALNSLLHFNLKEAFLFNLLPFMLMPLFVILYIQIKLNKKHQMTINIMLFISILYAILRNISFFNFLAP